MLCIELYRLKRTVQSFYVLYLHQPLTDILSSYNRFVPSFLRLGSWNVVMFVSFEQLKRLMMVSKKKLEATT